MKLLVQPGDHESGDESLIQPCVHESGDETQVQPCDHESGDCEEASRAVTLLLVEQGLALKKLLRVSSATMTN